VAAYRQAIGLRPDSALAYNNLGLALLRLQDPGPAEAAFRKASDLRPDYAEALTNLGTALNHQRRRREAEAAYRKAIDRQPEFAPAHLNLASTLMQQARFDEALGFIRTGTDLLRVGDPLRQKRPRLLEDCRRFMALDARLPAILQRTEKAAGAAELIEFARLCSAKELYAASARLFAEALAADPRLADNVPAGTRYNAASAAALAGSATGKGADRLDGTERSRWRRQALDWLRQDLRWWAKVLADGTAGSDIRVRQWMRTWQIESDYDCVRTPGALARLPDLERGEWDKLWADVEALRQQAAARSSKVRP
jgi:tetratricopeptide (TPR) repeat protein